MRYPSRLPSPGLSEILFPNTSAEPNSPKKNKKM